MFSEIKKIEYDAQKNYQYKLRLLKAQIGYTSGRFREFSYFKESFYNLIDKTLSGGEAELKRFKDFLKQRLPISEPLAASNFKEGYYEF
ncbi:type III-A CRISPR-associated protein Csm2 [Caloramator sp. Dgby_cultured_2]|uniref:type III-A CRISPR-associated protein Csm2 n=1 Tax=Caloramator sp. Dgby_cultured_2 TaxID=3029174 RepID=UPI00237E77AA|nr:type III-A CRISPR-associated protein Csm2 [Caloramator sp. Dgby_cultured_2]WDU82949.1 type III-A CRISPR-associated protein Csm2 [Caloramator sp. Dgby_cultured_2]